MALIVHGIIVLDLELREGSRFCLPSSAIKSLVTQTKVLSSTRWREGVFLGYALFFVSGDVQYDKGVYFCTYLTDLYDFCVILYK